MAGINKDMGIAMPAAKAKTRCDDLLGGIFNALGQWSELERDIFTRAHYRGQSVKSIAQSMGMDKPRVVAILKECDRRLYNSLSKYRRSGWGKGSRPHSEAAAAALNRQNLESTREIPPKVNKHTEASRLAI